MSVIQTLRKIVVFPAFFLPFCPACDKDTDLDLKLSDSVFGKATANFLNWSTL